MGPVGASSRELHSASNPGDPGLHRMQLAITCGVGFRGSWNGPLGAVEARFCFQPDRSRVSVTCIDLHPRLHPVQSIQPSIT